MYPSTEESPFTEPGNPSVCGRVLLSEKVVPFVAGSFIFALLHKPQLNTMKLSQNRKTVSTVLTALFAAALGANAAPATLPRAYINDTLPTQSPAPLATDTTHKDSADYSNVTDAQFPGGESAWQAFLYSQIDPDLPVRKGAPVGQYVTIVQFKIDKEGKMTGIKALTHNGYGMEEELIRALQLAPDWKPATQDGEPVYAYRKQPITFFVEEVKRKKKRQRAGNE